MDFTAQLNPSMAILAALLYGLGMLLKKSPMTDKWIPTVLAVVGLLFGVIWNLLAGMPFEGAAAIGNAVLMGAIQGILYAASCVWVNQLVKQAGKTE